MNNQIFDFNRFAKVFVREFNRYKIKLLGIFGVFFGLFMLSVAYSYIFNTTPLDISFKAIGFVLIIIAPTIFSRNINRINAIFDFTMPASTFERFLVRWCLCVIIMPIIVLASLSIIACLYLIIPNGNCVDAGNNLLHVFKELTFDRIIAIASIQSFFFVGAYYFKKRSFIKTCLCLIAYSFVMGLIFTWSHQEMFLGNRHIFLGFNLLSNSSLMQIDGQPLTTQTNSIISVVWNLVAPVGLWVVSFLKLHETEI